MIRESVRKELEHVINAYGVGTDCGTPDYILADYLFACLEAFQKALVEKDVVEALEGK